MINTKNEAKSRLSDCGIKPSLHRIAVMEYLMEHYNHPTVDMIFNSLFPSIPTLSKTTVYNTLKLFEEKRAITTVTIDGKNMRYDADITKHAHFQCRKCGAILDLRIKDDIPVVVDNPENLLLDDCHVYFRGYCEECGKSYVL